MGEFRRWEAMSKPTCRDCGAIIRWMRTEAGKATPVDPEFIEAWVISPGEAPRITLVDEDGHVRTGHQVSAIEAGSEQIEGYVPHWATCPKANDFRPGGLLRP